MWQWKRDYLDVLLVPCGLLLMFGYHFFLLYRYLKYPQTTANGYENHTKRAWVARMLQVEIKERAPAITVISSNISAATALASISLVLSSIIGAMIGSTRENIFTGGFVYGSRSSSIIYTKYISLLSCFLVAFACFFQTARYLVHAGFLISMPHNDIPVSYVEKEVIKGSDFWLIGLRSLYFAGNLLFWVFGPIPMFVYSMILVGVLLNLDRNTTPLHPYKPVETNEFSNIDQKRTVAVRAVHRLLKEQENKQNLIM